MLQVTFREPEAAMRACVDPAPVIDGRRANCNLASLGVQRSRPTTPQHGTTQLLPFSALPFCKSSQRLIYELNLHCLLKNKWTNVHKLYPQSKLRFLYELTIAICYKLTLLKHLFSQNEIYKLYVDMDSLF
jgi:hypothetical protein